MRNAKLKFFAALLAAVLAAGAAWADVKIDEANFPDVNFRNWVKENAAEGGDVLTDKQIAAVTEMDVSYSDISVLNGIEHFTALAELTCWSNGMTALDLSKNAALKVLRCSGNEITKLSLPEVDTLKMLYCDQNTLGAIDVSSQPGLYVLSCRYNGIKSLDLSRNTALTELDCWGNELTALDLSKNANLEKLNCLENPIKELDLSNNKNLSEASLPDTATVTLPGEDKIAMADFRVTKGKDGKFRLDLSKYGDKIGMVTVDAQGVEEVKVTSSKGVHTFKPFDGKVIVPYRTGKNGELSLVLFVQEEL